MCSSDLDWVNSPARYVGNLTKPTNASLTRVMDAVKVAFDIGGDAWTYNAKITGVQAYYTEGTLYGTVVGFVNVNGTRYQTRFPDTPTTARKCSVGVTYQLPDTTRSVMRTDVDCPSN